MQERCYRCGNNSSLFFVLEDHFENQYKWCPACVLKLMKANKQYIEGPLQGDQDNSLLKGTSFDKRKD